VLDYIDFGNPVSDSPLNQGLLAWWLTLPGRKGNTWFDLKGKYHAPLTNAPKWGGGGRPGGFADLQLTRGSSQYASATGLLGQPAEVTICGWARPTDLTGGVSEFFSIGDAVTIRFGEDSIYQVKGFYHAAGAWTSGASYVIPDPDNWHHICLTIKTTTSQQYLYINGQQQGSDTNSADIVYTGLGTDTFLGAHANGGARYFNGNMDSMRAYSRALSAGEVFKLYEDERTGHIQTLRRFSRKAYLFATSQQTTAAVVPGIKTNIDYGNPVSDDPLNKGRVAWWLTLPNKQGYKWVDLKKKYDATFYTVTGHIAKWRSGPPNSYGSLTAEAVDQWAYHAHPFDNVAGFTVSMRVLLPVSPVDLTDLFGKWDDGTGVRQQFARYNVSNGGVQWFVMDAANVNQGNITTTRHTLGAWNHLTFVADGTNLLAYVNGKFDVSSALTGPYIPSDTNDWRIMSGRAIDNSLLASYDDFSYHTRALSASEVSALYTDSKLGHPRTLRKYGRLFASSGVAALIRTQYAFRWRYDDGSETTATWLAAENTNITRGKTTNTRLRIQVDTSGGDPPSEALKLQYRKVGDTTWKDIS
jgi:hypothetical protein